MNALIITMTTTEGVAVGLAFIAIGSLLQYFFQLEAEDRADVRAQAEEEAENLALSIATQRQPGDAS